MRDVEWIGSSLADLKRFPRAVQRDIGFALFRIQLGEMPGHTKPLRGLAGVYEIRSDFMTDTYRTVYAAKVGTKIYVLHAFQKKSKSGIATPKPDMELIRTRLAAARAFAQEEER